MEHKVVYGIYSYTLPDSVRFRGKEYEVESVCTQNKNLAKRKAKKFIERTGSNVIIKAFKANETENGDPVLYVLCGRAK